MDEQITKIISNQLHIKLGQITQENLKIGKQLDLIKYSQKYWRQGN